MLVSNRIDTVEKTLKSIKRIMDRVPSELIVVDTVGEEKSDGSLAIAKQYATKLVHFDWINDFAAARNAGLKEATGEWFMFLDDDEEFIEVDDLCDFFVSGEYKKYCCATYKIHDYTDNKGNFIVTNMNRMVKIEPETKFLGRVHEYISPLRLPVKELNSFIDHHGYVFLTPEDRLKKFNRNWPLLMEEYKDDPWNVRIRLHLIQACLDVEGQEEKADDICLGTITAGDDRISEEERKKGFFQWICMAYVKLVAKRDIHEETVKRVDLVRKEKYLSELTRLAVSVMDTKASNELGLPERAMNDLLEIQKCYLLLKNDRQMFFWQAELDLGDFMESESLLFALKNGLSAMRKAGFDTKNETRNVFFDLLQLYKDIHLEYLEKEAKNHPESLGFRAQYDDLIAQKDAVKGLSLIKETLKTFKDESKDPYYGFLISVMFRLFESLGVPSSEAAIEYTTLKQEGLMKEHAICAAASLMTRICLIQGTGQEAVLYVNDYFEAYNKIIQGVDTKSEELKGDLGRFVEDEIFNEMLFFGANVLAGAGDVSGAWELLHEIPWGRPDIKNAEDCLNLAFYVNSLEEKPEYLYGIIKAVMKNPVVVPAFSEMLRSQLGIKQAVDRCLSLVGGKA